jgi:hypothetical protein
VGLETMSGAGQCQRSEPRQLAKLTN